MNKGEGKFLRQTNKAGYIAFVKLEVESEWNGLEIITDCHGKGFTSQGYIEEVPANGYDDWKRGAVNGVKFALEAINKHNTKVVITHIEGLTTDTNPTIVSAAAARALWNALGISVPEKTEKNLQVHVLQSWSNDPSFVPEDNFLISK
jgi:hypothetical protein